MSIRALVNSALVCLAGVTPTSAAAVARSGPETVKPTVDLGYAVYRGLENGTTGLTVWKGIRYAAPPTGKLRWQAPKPPLEDRAGVVVADTFGPQCPQQGPASGFATASGFAPPSWAADEDCLYLNVYTPTEKRNPVATEESEGADDGDSGSWTGGLPVLVFIHGGGYGADNSKRDMSEFINANGNRLVAVSIQYRLGAFGFLASPEIKAKGALNAGLLDQEFALQWVQRHISKFGGNPHRVTLYGESAGGGSVMILSVARDGKTGTSLFRNAIAASPYLPTQPYYNDEIPKNRYRDFAIAAGCPGSGPVFDCLVSADSQTLMLANANATGPRSGVPFGNWAFIPVTDGTYLTAPASSLLSRGLVNGRRILTANNANEGTFFVPTTVSTEEVLRAWIKSNYVNLSEQNVTAILDAYPSVPGPDDPTSPRFETSGLGPATAVNVSQVATGHQQRAFNIYAESTFVCPAYWLADAFSGARGRESFLYQYSIPFARHGVDLTAAFLPPEPSHGPDFIQAFRRMYGNFIVSDDPSIDNRLANGASAPDQNKPNPASRWPRWTVDNRAFLNLNQTGGTPYRVLSSTGVMVTEFSQPGLRNDFSQADANTWEGGRGRRCDFWKTINAFVPQ
ncbi:inactive carboxylesterase 4 [Magnaporthiopsis poae ATCC 64411]|uniref:Carboxylic ester hydrolase n=1 Tax=Magnaporthiopsis poae (strain ATCC 64411 / 73-15) TaxID=644358 RepID=A0A0C4DMQ5_MAGP6|nr:inactive carboxylesterase 4 [Magnaporthiopsis poae ATCC 64411]